MTPSAQWLELWALSLELARVLALEDFDSEEK
jgi:hypothetical protein